MVLKLHGVVVGDDHTDAGALKHFNTLGVGCELRTVDDHRIGFQSNDLFRIEDVVVKSADGRNGLQFRVGCGKDLIFAHAGGFPMILRHADNAFEGVSAAYEHEVLNVVGDDDPLRLLGEGDGASREILEGDGPAARRRQGGVAQCRFAGGGFSGKTGKRQHRQGCGSCGKKKRTASKHEALRKRKG